MLKFKKFTLEYLDTLSISILRAIGREIGVRSSTSKKKEQLIADILKIQSGELTPITKSGKGAPPKGEINLDAFLEDNFSASNIDGVRYDENKLDKGKNKLEFRNTDVDDAVTGVLEQHSMGYGFLRVNNFENTSKDVYLSSQTIKRYNLRRGDLVKGIAKTIRNGDTPAVQEVLEVNGLSVDKIRDRVDFDRLTPYYPTEYLQLENEDNASDIAIRCIDLFAPIGLGQRGLIVAPPKTGKTTLIKKIAQSICANRKDVKLIVLLIDERPEEVTDIKRSVNAEVIYSTFDQSPEHHVRVAELAINYAKRKVELGEDVVVLLDSITRLTRAYNTTIETSGKTLSGGLDPAALQGPKRIFGSARNIEDGGSLTILSTALIETGSRMDDVVYEEFKGTGNMEIHLSRELSEKRVFPAIDLYKSGTRKEELLLSSEVLSAVYKLRKILAEKQDATDILIEMMKKSKSNQDFIAKLPVWLNLYNK